MVAAPARRSPSPAHSLNRAKARGRAFRHLQTFLLLAQAPNRKPSPSRNVKRRNSARAFPCVSSPGCCSLPECVQLLPGEVPGPDLGHIKRFLNRKSGPARTNCASLTLLGASAAGTTFAVVSAGCAGGAQWQGRGQGLAVSRFWPRHCHGAAPEHPERTQTTLFRAAALPVSRNNKPKDEAPRLAKTPVL